MKHYIELKNIEVYAYHGCLPQEAVIGSSYSVNLKIQTDFQNAMYSDELSDTIDYTALYNIVEEQMHIRSQLLENVAWRIAQAVKNQYKDSVKSLEVEVIKINPPIGNSSLDSVGVKIIL